MRCRCGLVFFLFPFRVLIKSNVGNRVKSLSGNKSGKIDRSRREKIRSFIRPLRNRQEIKPRLLVAPEIRVLLEYVRAITVPWPVRSKERTKKKACLAGPRAFLNLPDLCTDLPSILLRDADLEDAVRRVV